MFFSFYILFILRTEVKLAKMLPAHSSLATEINNISGLKRSDRWGA